MYFVVLRPLALSSDLYASANFKGITTLHFLGIPLNAPFVTVFVVSFLVLMVNFCKAEHP